MENGDRQKVLQHRLLGIFPDYLDFQRIVAWGSGSHVPTAVHVSDGATDGETYRGSSWETTLGMYTQLWCQETLDLYCLLLYNVTVLMINVNVELPKLSAMKVQSTVEAFRSCIQIIYREVLIHYIYIYTYIYMYINIYVYLYIYIYIYI